MARPEARFPRMTGRRFRIEGHRGSRASWPENTLPGFRAALEAGTDAIELDVGLTRDGVVVVCHDPALDPDLTRAPDGTWIAPPGPVLARSTLAELRAYDVGRARPGGRTASDFPRQRAVDGARLPTLAEVFELAAGWPATVDVELKTNPLAPGLAATEALVDAVLAVAEASRALPFLALRSFHWRGLEHAVGRLPGLRATWLTRTGGDDPRWRGSRAGPAPGCLAGMPGATWGPGHRDLTRRQVEHAQALGLQVVPWTVNEAADMVRLAGWGVDGICTDDVALARATLRQPSGPL